MRTVARAPSPAHRGHHNRWSRSTREWRHQMLPRPSTGRPICQAERRYSSYGAAEPPCGGLAVAVEHRGDDPSVGSPIVGQPQPAALERHQPAVDEGLQLVDEFPAEEITDLRFAVAEQLLYDPAALLVVGIADDAMGRGKQAGRNPDLVTPRVLFILNNQVGELGNGTGAKADQHFRAVIGKSLEIATQPPLAR